MMFANIEVINSDRHPHYNMGLHRFRFIIKYTFDSEYKDTLTNLSNRATLHAFSRNEFPIQVIYFKQRNEFQISFFRGKFYKYNYKYHIKRSIKLQDCLNKEQFLNSVYGGSGLIKQVAEYFDFSVLYDIIHPIAADCTLNIIPNVYKEYTIVTSS